MWEESEKLIRGLLEETLEMKSKDLTMERAHRTSFKVNDEKRATIVKFLN